MRSDRHVMDCSRRVETKSMRDWSKSPAELKTRRVKAARLLRQGKSLSAVARAVGASVSSIHRWKQAMDQSGMKGLDGQRHMGPSHRLTLSQQGDLRNVFMQGAAASGYKDGRWFADHIMKVIERRYGVIYRRCHIGRLLRGLGLTDADLASQGFQKISSGPRFKRRQALSSLY